MKMYKIKDNVDLKQLENFGYSYYQNIFNGLNSYYYKYIDDGHIEKIVIYAHIDDSFLKTLSFKERQILFLVKKFGVRFIATKYIKDLINAGFVENVERN